MFFYSLYFYDTDKKSTKLVIFRTGLMLVKFMVGVKLLKCKTDMKMEKENKTYEK